MLDKDENNYEALVGMGKVHEKMNDLDSSIEYMERASHLVERNGNSLFYLGTLHLRNKNLDKAVQLFEEVLSL